MALKAERVDTWAATIKDQPGGLSAKLETLAAAKVNLEFIIARRSPDKPGTGVVFVTPLQGDPELKAASEAGFSATNRLHSVRVEGENQAGLAGKITDKLGKSGINLRGFSGAVIGKRFVLHLAFDSFELRNKAIEVIKANR